MLRLIVLLVALAHSVYSGSLCTAPGIVRGTTSGQFLTCVERNGTLQTVVNQCSEGTMFDVMSNSCTGPRLLMLMTVQNGGLGAESSDDGADTTVQRDCKSAGAYCSNCNTLSFCTEMSNGPAVELRHILDVPCGDEAACVTKTGCVSYADGGFCREGDFECGDVGLYPDLYDCTKFHVCTNSLTEGLTDYPQQCSGGIVGNRWDPETSTCGWSENTTTCLDAPVPTCNQTLEMGSAGGQIYYICMENEAKHTISPKLFRCPMNLEFDAAAYACV